ESRAPEVVEHEDPVHVEADGGRVTGATRGPPRAAREGVPGDALGRPRDLALPGLRRAPGVGEAACAPVRIAAQVGEAVLRDRLSTELRQRMTTASVENVGSIFADPAAYADPERWHAAAKRIREESPILK